MWLRTSAGSYVQITAVHAYIKRQHVYNLSVEDLHTYYVLAGQVSILVHNAGCEPARIALGLASRGIVDKAEASGALHLMDYGLDWKWFIRQGIKEASADNPSVVFEVYLDGLTASRLGLDKGADLAARVNKMADIGDAGRGNMFAWELSELRKAGLLGRARFFENGATLPNPF